VTDLKVQEKLLTSRRMNHLVIELEGEEAFSYERPEHLAAVIRALQRYPTVDGVVTGGLKETLIAGGPLEVLKKLSEIRRKLERFSESATPPQGKAGKPPRRCSTCPSSPSELLKKELQRFDSNPLEWTPKDTGLKGLGLAQCKECTRRSERFLRELSGEVEEIFGRIELLG